MKNRLLYKLFVLHSLLITPSFIFGQNAVLSSGGVATGSTGSISYSIGQVFYKSCNGTGGSIGGFRDTSSYNRLEYSSNGESDFTISEGVQQAFSIEVVAALENSAGIELTYHVYPNPTSDFLILKSEDHPGQNLFWQLYDNHGRLLDDQQIENTETIISLSGMVETLYFLKVINSQNQKETKVFKIIKN